MKRTIQGVFAAAVTPLHDDLTFDLEGQLSLLNFLAQRGCHGALIFGTTGEGPSFSPHERLVLLRNALTIHQEYPDFRLLAGTGTPSLNESIALTRQCFDLGYDGVVVLPPYYFKKVTDDGLFSWFSQVINKSVPFDGALLGYHIPGVSGVSLSLNLLQRLKDAFPTQFAGLKNSSPEPTFAQQLGLVFGDELIILTGNDRLFSLTLNAHASGCITATANILSPLHRKIWDAYIQGLPADETQTQLTEKHIILSQTGVFPPLIKAILHRQFHLPFWSVYPPLDQASSFLADQILNELQPLD